MLETNTWVDEAIASWRAVVTALVEAITHVRRVRLEEQVATERGDDTDDEDA